MMFISILCSMHQKLIPILIGTACNNNGRRLFFSVQCKTTPNITIYVIEKVLY